VSVQFDRRHHSGGTFGQWFYGTNFPGRFAPARR
jgi:hypothetical protein